MQILQPYQKPKQKSMNQREYRAALRGNSKKLKLTNAIDCAVAKSRTKQQFIEQLQRLGYGVKWINHYKYITYTTPDGQRFRDNRLLNEKYLKNNMEELFAYEYATVETNQSNTGNNRADSRSINRTDTADISDAQTGAIQSVGTAHFTDWERHCAEHGFDIRTADAEIVRRNDENDCQRQSVSGTENNGRKYEVDPIFSRGRVIESDEPFERDDAYRTEEHDERAEGQGYDAVETQTEMGGGWSDIAVNSLYLAADLAMIGGTDNEKSKTKYVRERKHGQKKKKQNEQSQGEGYEIKM